MQTILFPTNFSDLSINAFNYALEYAIKSESKIVVYHSLKNDEDIPEDLRAVYEELEIENFRNKKDTFPPFEKIIRDKNARVKIKYVVEVGDFVESIKRYIAKREEKIDMVIMGTKSQSKLMELFVSTNTVQVLEDISKPVMAVPEGARFDGVFDNIAFLVDYKEDEREPLQAIISKAREFNARLHVIHFDLAHSESVVPQMDAFRDSLQVAEFHDVEFVSIDSINIQQSLKQYCDSHRIDLVCLINYRRNFYQRLFTYSLAEELIHNMSLPILAIYRD